ncbi:hypothetical protein HanIR_Chr09g0402241 [Helianthus annuus]|nr:hypothetical protein HanIR_Chr09g0402241 [Helianthus annuus]
MIKSINSNKRSTINSDRLCKWVGYRLWLTVTILTCGSVRLWRLWNNGKPQPTHEYRFLGNH